jgi:hypothetical protein
MNGIPAETANTEAGAPAEQPRPAQEPRSAAQKAHVAPSKARSGKKASPAKKANKGAKSAQSPKKTTGAPQRFDSLWPPGFRLGGFSLSVPRAGASVLPPSPPASLFTACLLNGLGGADPPVCEVVAAAR